MRSTAAGRAVGDAAWPPRAPWKPGAAVLLLTLLLAVAGCEAHLPDGPVQETYRQLTGLDYPPPELPELGPPPPPPVVGADTVVLMVVGQVAVPVTCWQAERNRFLSGPPCLELLPPEGGTLYLVDGRTAQLGGPTTATCKQGQPPQAAVMVERTAGTALEVGYWTRGTHVAVRTVAEPMPRAGEEFTAVERERLANMLGELLESEITRLELMQIEELPLDAGGEPDLLYGISADAARLPEASPLHAIVLARGVVPDMPLLAAFTARQPVHLLNAIDIDGDGSYELLAQGATPSGAPFIAALRLHSNEVQLLGEGVCAAQNP